ncbi:Uncharacterized protein L484_022143 [Morus notabilis]|uniref:AB hydrolase-1 domain-containing protein n=1 Tax=Morus notabilis TaxID=981085 RepID=W9QDQ0_9ROSA|nr:uncharacterized protein LOC21404965 [Morus notabilis]EXB29471.1 Uncharacterized protein L484_022143 [Morus notabilis]
MANWFCLSAVYDWYLRCRFSMAGLKPTTTDLGDGTIMHCWVPRKRADSKPNLLLIHGIGANAMWQFSDFVSPLVGHFNLYIPDLVFYGASWTTRPERSESFHARCVAVLMEAQGVRRMHVVGLSYGGFVGYWLAAQFKERVERVVLCCAGVCMEDKDMEEGMFQVRNVDEAVSVLQPQTVSKARDLLRMTFYEPLKFVPGFFLNDFIKFMCTEHVQERADMIRVLHKDRKLSNLPKITQPTLILWGEHDLIFPIELAHRLKRHVGENAQLVIIKNAGHAINAEKPKEMCNHYKSFLLSQLPPKAENGNNNIINGHKVY